MLGVGMIRRLWSLLLRFGVTIATILGWWLIASTCGAASASPGESVGFTVATLLLIVFYNWRISYAVKKALEKAKQGRGCRHQADPDHDNDQEDED